MTFRLAVISNVRADVDALRDALAQIDRLGCDRIVCCGDLIEDGKHPEATLRLLRQREIACVRGDRDRWALKRAGAGPGLSAGALAFLGSLPSRLDFEVEGVRVAVCHGQPQSDTEGISYEQFSLGGLRRFLNRVDAEVLLVGQSDHGFGSPAEGSGWVFCPGDLLRDPQMPRVSIPQFNPVRGQFESAELPPGGTFGVLELPAMRFTFHRVSDGLELFAVGESGAKCPLALPRRAPRLKLQWLGGPYAATDTQEAQWVSALERGLQWEHLEVSGRVDALRAATLTSAIAVVVGQGTGFIAMWGHAGEVRSSSFVVSWSPFVNIAAPISTSAQTLAVVRSGSAVMALWTQYPSTPASWPHVYASVNAGAGWSPALEVETGGSMTAGVTATTPDNFLVYWTSATSGGQGFTRPYAVSTGWGVATAFPLPGQLAVGYAGGTYAACLMTSTAVYDATGTNGFTWSAPTQLFGAASNDCRVVSGGSRLAIFFSDVASYKQVYASLASGSSWPAPTILGGIGSSGSDWDAVGTQTGWAATWEQYGPSGNPNVMVTLNTGAGWSTPEALGTNVKDPHIATDGTAWYATWVAAPLFQAGSFARRYDPALGQWAAVTNLSSTATAATAGSNGTTFAALTTQAEVAGFCVSSTAATPVTLSGGALDPVPGITTDPPSPNSCPETIRASGPCGEPAPRQSRCAPRSACELLRWSFCQSEPAEVAPGRLLASGQAHETATVPERCSRQPHCKLLAREVQARPDGALR